MARPSVLAESLPDDVAAFVNQHPGIRISLDERMSPAIVRGLREGSADVGVLWDHINDLAGLRVLPWRSDRLVVAMSPGHALARRPALRLADTLDQPSINVAPGGQMDQLLRRQAALLGRLPAHRMQVSSIDAACRLPPGGRRPGPGHPAARGGHAGAGRMAFVPLDEPWAVRRFVLLTRGQPLLSAAAAALVTHLGAVAQADGG